MKTNLYKIETEYLQLMADVEDVEGVLTPELEEALTINKTQLEGKSTAYLHIISTREALNNQAKDEIKRLQAFVKANDNLVIKLRSRLLDAVKLFGAFEVGINKFGTRKSSTVEVDDVNSLPSDFKTVKVVESADKKAIKEALKNGVVIEGCSIIEKINLKIN